MHRFILTEETKEGSYIQLDEYMLKRAQRVRGPGSVAHLAISNFRTIGQSHDRIRNCQEESSRTNHRDTILAHQGQLSKISHKSAEPVQSQTNTSHKGALQVLEESQSNKIPNRSTSHLPPPLPPPAKKRKVSPPTASIASTASAPPTPYPPLYTLHAILTHAQRQNLRLSLLALITSVLPFSPGLTSTSTPHHTKTPGQKRVLRVLDTTSPRPILLSVFVSPSTFEPEPGTVALFRGLRNHRFEGCSLNAYRGDCEGRAWYVPFPEIETKSVMAGIVADEEVEEMGEKVQRLRRLWHEMLEKRQLEERLADEALEREQERGAGLVDLSKCNKTEAG
ncbi:MAG: hypothetical protein M1819_001664 [Sarea resinae]|nr:MAG: hypothetical protein M1819_001664 [Sarea resinae]